MPDKSIETMNTSALRDLDPGYRKEESSETPKRRTIKMHLLGDEEVSAQLKKVTYFKGLSNDEQKSMTTKVVGQIQTDSKQYIEKKAESKDVKDARLRFIEKYKLINNGKGEWVKGGEIQDDQAVTSCAIVEVNNSKATPLINKLQPLFYAKGFVPKGWNGPGEEGKAFREWKQNNPQIGDHLKASGLDDTEVEEFYQNQYFLQIANSHKDELKDAGMNDDEIDEILQLVKDFNDMKLYLGIDFQIEAYIQDLQQRAQEGDASISSGLDGLLGNIQSINPEDANRKGYFDQEIGGDAIEGLANTSAIRTFVGKILFTQHQEYLTGLLHKVPANRQQIYMSYLMGEGDGNISTLGEKEEKKLTELKGKVDAMIDKEVPTVQKELTKNTNISIKKYALMKVIPILRDYLNMTYADNQENFLAELTIDENGMVFDNRQRFNINGTINGQKMNISFDTKGNVYVQDYIHKEDNVDIIGIGSGEEKLIGEFPDMQAFILDAKRSIPFAEILTSSASLGAFSSNLNKSLESKSYQKDVLVAQNSLQMSINKNILYKEIQELTGFADTKIDKRTHPNQYAFYQKMDQGIDKLSIEDMRTLMAGIKEFKNTISTRKPREQKQYTDKKNRVLWDLFNDDKIAMDKKETANDTYPNSRSVFLGQVIYNSVEQGYNDAAQGFDVMRLQAINACMKEGRDVDVEVGKNTGITSAPRYQETMKWIEPHYARKDEEELKILEQQFA